MAPSLGSMSIFTLTLMQATGWYLTDLTKAEPITWGLGRGCGYTDVNW